MRREGGGAAARSARTGEACAALWPGLHSCAVRTHLRSCAGCLHVPGGVLANRRVARAVLELVWSFLPFITRRVAHGNHMDAAPVDWPLLSSLVPQIKSLLCSRGISEHRPIWRDRLALDLAAQALLE